MTAKQKIIVITGPTATGKSDLAIRLAKKFGGEVISADSRQVYRGLNIGTGKVTKKEMGGIPHYMLDVANPKRQFSVAQYVKKADKVISKILSRNKIPIICGGTGFYISALLGEEVIPDIPPDTRLRARLAEKSAGTLFGMLRKLYKGRADKMNLSDRQNPRRLIRAIEIALANKSMIAHDRYSDGDSGVKKSEVLKIGLALPPEELKKRIHTRLLKRLKQGMIAEAKNLHRRGLSWKRMEELGLEYRYLAKYLKKEITKDEMIERLNTKIWHYAKRQMTWFKKNKDITWFRMADVRKIFRPSSLFL